MRTTLDENSAVEKGAANSSQVSIVEPEFVGIAGACRVSGLSRSTIYNLINAGSIRSVNFRQSGRIKGRRLIHLARLREFLNSLPEGRN